MQANQLLEGYSQLVVEQEKFQTSGKVKERKRLQVIYVPGKGSTFIQQIGTYISSNDSVSHELHKHATE